MYDRLSSMKGKRMRKNIGGPSSNLGFVKQHPNGGSARMTGPGLRPCKSQVTGWSSYSLFTSHFLLFGAQLAANSARRDWEDLAGLETEVQAEQAVLASPRFWVPSPSQRFNFSLPTTGGSVIGPLSFKRNIIVTGKCSRV